MKLDFTFSEEQLAVQELARQILSDACTHDHLKAIEDDPNGTGVDVDLWRSLADAGLLGVALPEKCGGSDLGLQALFLLCEEQGRTTAPVPIVPVLVCSALAIAEFGSEAQRARFLPPIVSGETLLCAALEESGGQDPARPRTRATAQGEAWVLDGEKACVPIAPQAERMLVPARTEDGRVGVFLVDPRAEGVTLEAGIGNNWERLSMVLLEGVRVSSDDLLGTLDDGVQIVEFIEERARVAISATMLGLSEEALRRTAEYTATRKQFGRAIATFQGVALRAADAYIDVESMRSTVWHAGWRLEAGLPAAHAVVSAKWWACRGGHRVVHTAQHLHGGIGSDIDYPIHRFFLWSQQLQVTLGGASVQLERLGRLIASDANA